MIGQGTGSQTGRLIIKLEKTMLEAMNKKDLIAYVANVEAERASLQTQIDAAQPANDVDRFVTIMTQLAKIHDLPGFVWDPVERREVEGNSLQYISDRLVSSVPQGIYSSMQWTRERLETFRDDYRQAKAVTLSTDMGVTDRQKRDACDLMDKILERDAPRAQDQLVSHQSAYAAAKEAFRKVTGSEFTPYTGAKIKGFASTDERKAAEQRLGFDVPSHTGAEGETAH